MKEGQTLWNRDELILAVNLYVKIPFGKMHQGNSEVQELAKLINRTPSSVARRLGNFASFDPVLRARGITGLTNSGKLAETVWNEFHENWDRSFEESEQLLANYKKTKIEKLYDIDFDDIEKGMDKMRLVKTRINQYRFRQIVMTNYNNSCCITGISQNELLIASHITPWSQYENNRLNPSNGLCLNALHDKAFDSGLLTILAEDFTIQISPKFKKMETEEIQNHFLRYDGKEIILPKKFLPNPQFLKIHNEYYASKN